MINYGKELEDGWFERMRMREKTNRLEKEGDKSSRIRRNIRTRKKMGKARKTGNRKSKSRMRVWQKKRKIMKGRGRTGAW